MPVEREVGGTEAREGGRGRGVKGRGGEKGGKDEIGEEKGEGIAIGEGSEGGGVWLWVMEEGSTKPRPGPDAGGRRRRRGGDGELEGGRAGVYMLFVIDLRTYRTRIRQQPRAKRAHTHTHPTDPLRHYCGAGRQACSRHCCGTYMRALRSLSSE